MALFGLNWEESKWPGHFSSTFLNFFASKIGVKLPPGKKVPWHRRCAALCWGSNCHFFQKNAFFGQKKAFFQKVHFIQKCSVTQNTVFQCVKNNFFLSQKKLIFFTILNLVITWTLQWHLNFAKIRWHLKHDEGSVAPQLQRDPLDGGAALAVQLLPHLGGASEREDGHLMGNIL